MRKIGIYCGAIVLGLALLGGCRTTHETPTGPSPSETETAYKQRVVDAAPSGKALTAKMKCRVATGKREVALGGNLRMLRDDVIQLQLTFLGMEVGRLEFTEMEVLVIDRVNKAYARVPYSKVDFLRAAELDFGSLQAVFWNSLFCPGAEMSPAVLEEFRLAEAGSHTLLSLKSAEKLNYDFLTITETARIDRLMVSSKNSERTENLVCTYADWVPLGDGEFPKSIRMNFSGSQSYSLDLELSSLRESEDWEKRTKVGSKYVLMDVNKYLEHLIDY